MSTTAGLQYVVKQEHTAVIAHIKYYALTTDQVVTVLPTVRNTFVPDAKSIVYEIIVPETSIAVQSEVELRGILEGTGALAELQREHRREIEQEQVRS